MSYYLLGNSTCVALLYIRLLSRIILRNKIDHIKIVRFYKQKRMHDDDDDGYESPAR